MSIVKKNTLLMAAGFAAAILGGCVSHPIRQDAAGGRPLLGVIRWDMYTGDLFTTQKQEFGFLKPEQYQWRAPFFVRRTGNPEAPLRFNPDNLPEIYQQAMEQEIGFAAAAKIDYWAFGYEAHPPPGLRHSLRDALDAYLASQKAAIDTTAPTWVRAYLDENFRQWRFFSRAASHDPNQGPTLPSEQASTGAPASLMQP